MAGARSKKAQRGQPPPLARLADRIARHRWVVLGIWLALVAVSLPLFIHQSDNLTGEGFNSPRSESARLERMVGRDFPGAARADLVLVLQPRSPLTRAEAGKAVAAYSHRVRVAEGTSVGPAGRPAAVAALEQGRTAALPLRLSDAAEAPIDVAERLRSSLKPGRLNEGRQLTPYLAGQPALWAAFSEQSRRDLQKAELIGFPLIAVVLITVFGTLIAASLPLLMALFAVVITGAFVFGISFGLNMSVFVSNIATMIGIGVGVDYSLFILTRYRQAIRAGRGRSKALSEALATSGLAVTFSGLAVIVALAGLWLVDNRTLQSMALGAMIVVAVSMLLAVTLLPALIALFGHRVEGDGKIKEWVLGTIAKALSKLRPGGGSSESFWHRWSELVMKRPGIAASLVVVALAAIIAPTFDLKLSSGALEQMPASSEARVGAELAVRASGGSVDSISVLTRAPEGVDPARSTRLLVGRIEEIPSVGSVSPVRTDGRQALFEIATMSEAAESDRATGLVTRLREMEIPAWSASTGATALVGGQPANVVDSRAQVADSMWKIFAFVLCLSYLVLFFLLRSLLLPLKAIAMNLLSIGAAYGVLVIVFQWGALDFLPTFDSTGALDVMVPPLILAMIFGLSMDYEVFLLSRIKERYQVHGNTRKAVSEGLEAGASTISSAALIMILVFLTFVFTGADSVKQIGLGCAVAIAFDATVVRLVLVPATMQLLGKWNWWIPAWMDRLLPHIPLEGGEESVAPRRKRRSGKSSGGKAMRRSAPRTSGRAKA